VKTPRTPPGPHVRPSGNVQYISKAAALENAAHSRAALEAAAHHNAVLAAMLAVLIRRYGAHILSRMEFEASEPEQLHVQFCPGDIVKCWWGDGDPPKSPLELVPDGEPDATG
jgi:hypothetical protein